MAMPHFSQNHLPRVAALAAWFSFELGRHPTSTISTSYRNTIRERRINTESSLSGSKQGTAVPFAALAKKRVSLANQSLSITVH
jgi:hypothetical protein